MPIQIDERASIERVFDDLGPFTLFDVGAAEGEYTEVVRARGGFKEAHLFEPRSDGAAALRERYKEDQDVIVNSLALADFTGMAALMLSDNPHWSHLRGLFEGERSEPVQVTTLDAYLADIDLIAPIFLKIDTEGFEMSVMRGAVESIKAGLIPAIQFEYGGTWGAWGGLKDAAELLEGFTILELRDGRLQEILSTVDDFKYRNYLALRT